MTNNEKLRNEAICGEKSSLKDLMYNAGSGDAEAQFCLAQYYTTRKNCDDSLFFYWMKKSADNGFMDARTFLGLPAEKRKDSIELSSEAMSFLIRGAASLIFG